MIAEPAELTTKSGLETENYKLIEPKPETTETTKPATKKTRMAKRAQPPEDGKNRVEAARAKNLDLAIAQIQKDYGEGAIMRMGKDETPDLDVIPTGNLLIDRALGVGGFPKGRIV